MGQQQLLLIVLGVIIVGIAVAVGMNMFSTSAAEANRDAIISDLNFISALARGHYRKPVDMGGGGNSFENFEIPTAILETANGTLEHTQTGHNTDHIHFTATGKEIGEDGTDPIRIEYRITVDVTKVSIKN